MHKQPYLRAILECMLAGIAIAAIATMALSVSILNFILMFIPVPIIFMINRWDIRFGIASLAIAVILLGMALPAMSIVFILLVTTPLSIVFGIAIKKKYPSFRTVIMGAAVVLASIAVSIEVFALSTGTNIFEYFAGQMLEFFNQTISYYKNAGIDNNTIRMIEQFKDNNFDFIDLSRIVIPAGIIIYSLACSFLNYFIVIKVLQKYKYDVRDIPPFSEWKLPRGTGRGLLGINILAYLGAYFGLNNFDIVFASTYVLLVFVFSIQGLSVIDFYIRKSKLIPFVRILIDVFILLFFGMFLSIIGLLDQPINIRKIGKDDNNLSP
ncbi:MAG: DUF2232 domain-containing protein [Clostridia bacterium]|nr:DUF2232 domain-containing protein [Clostridia bacterium]